MTGPGPVSLTVEVRQLLIEKGPELFRAAAKLPGGPRMLRAQRRMARQQLAESTAWPDVTYATWVLVQIDAALAEAEVSPSAAAEGWSDDR